jgi:hypothetical protein
MISAKLKTGVEKIRLDILKSIIIKSTTPLYLNLSIKFENPPAITINSAMFLFFFQCLKLIADTATTIKIIKNKSQHLGMFWPMLRAKPWLRTYPLLIANSLLA